MEKDNQDQAENVFVCGFFLIYVYCSWGLTSDAVSWEEEDGSTVDRAGGFSVDKGAEQDRLR